MFSLHPVATIVCQMFTAALLVFCFVFFTTEYHALHSVVFQAILAQASGFIVTMVTYARIMRTTELSFTPQYLSWALLGSLEVSLALFLFAYACRLTTGGDGPAAFLVVFLIASTMGTYGCYSAARALALAGRDSTD